MAIADGFTTGTIILSQSPKLGADWALTGILDNPAWYAMLRRLV